MAIKLVIGNRNYSSWSLRAWVYLRESNIEFEEVFIPLHVREGWRDEVASYSPAGRVPVLIDGDITVWDSMAIIGHLQEGYPSAVGWPENPEDRAFARSISAEMHSGFIALRNNLPQNLRMRRAAPITSEVQQQIDRIQDIWRECRERCGDRGPWLFGDFSIADVMFIPVALRFVTYGIPVQARAAEFVAATQNLPSVQQWISDAEREEFSVDFVDELRAGDMVIG